MARTAVAVVIAAVLAMGLAAVGVLVAREAGVDIDFLPTLITAVIVGTFMAFLLFAPRNGRGKEAEGFEVVGETRQTEVIEVKERR